MENIMKQLDSLFASGLKDSTITISVILIIIFTVNRLVNKIMNKKWPDAIYARRIKKIIIITLVFTTILAEIRPLQSFAGTLLASGGILAVIIGLASQEAASNLIAGAMIFAYKPFVIGDVVSIKEYDVYGTVIDIALRHSIIQTIQRTSVIVPNTIMNKSVIENISNVENRKANHLFITISFDSNLEKAIQIIQNEAIKHPLYIDGRTIEEIEKNIPSVSVYTMDFKDNGILLRATIFTKDSAEGFELLSDLRAVIKKSFDQNNITIPYLKHDITINKVD